MNTLLIRIIFSLAILTASFITWVDLVSGMVK